MKKVLCTPGFVLLFGILCAGCCHRYGIYKATAYVRESIGGTIAVDDHGNMFTHGNRKENLIYIQTAGAEPPHIKTIWIDTVAYDVQLFKVPTDTPIGRLKESNKEVRMAPKEGSQLWQLLLTPNPALLLDAATRKKVLQNPVVLTGEWKGKAFICKIKKQHPLQPILYE